MAYDGSIKIDTKIDTGGFSSGIEKMKSIASKGVSAMTTSFAAVTAGIAAGGTAAAKVGSSFEAAMSKVSAISGSAGKDLQDLTDKAKEMGAKTKFSASESAQALQYMAMAGWDTKSMLNGIDGIMSLAAADGLDLATTSDIVTDALTAFGLKASDSSHFADVLAKASSSANTNVSMLGESFKYIAPLAGTMGYSVEDVSLALGLMANASVKGSMAGTSLKTALSNLASPTDKVEGAMEKYGISISDAHGNALPLIDVLKQLREKFGGLSETEQAAAASTLFGKEAMSGMLAIINASDSDFKNLTENINNADGAAKSMADTMQDNLHGQITILKSALEGLGIEIYEGMQAPLKEAAVEAQEYVNRLTNAFKGGGLTGLIDEAGKIFGELAVKAAEAAPKMVDAAIKFLKSFVGGIVKNSSKLIEAAKTITAAIVNNLVKLLPSEVQKPVKDTVNIIRKSFDNGGLKRAINTVKTILINLGKAAANIAKVILPPLASVVDLVAGNLDKLLPLAVAVYTAYKSWQIISVVTKLITEHTAAVTAESLAEASSLGTITLKQIAVGALTGEISLATAAQYAWNAAMNANPIGIVITLVATLATGFATLASCQQDSNDATKDFEDATRNLEDANDRLSDTYDTLADKFSDFYSDIENAGSILDGFNDSILLSNERQQELAQKMDDTQAEITEIARLATEERRSLTSTEIERLDELFAKMHELSAQELAFEQEKQALAQTSAKALAETHKGTVESYKDESDTIVNTANETRDKVVEKAKEQLSEEIYLLEKRLESDKSYTQKMFENDREAARKEYDNAVAEANKKAADTLAILQKGYLDRADILNKTTEQLRKYNQKEIDENTKHKDNIKSINEKYNKDLQDFINEEKDNRLAAQKYKDYISAKDKEIEEEDTRHSKTQGEIRNKQRKLLDDENYQNQVKAFSELTTLYEFYSGETSKESQNIVNAFMAPLQNMPDDTKKKFEETLNGAVKGLEDKSSDLFTTAKNIVGGVINIFTKGFEIRSPSRVFRRIFKYTLEGGEGGLDDESPKLLSKAGKIGDSFTKKLKSGINADSLIGKMRDTVSASRFELGTALTAKVIHNVNVTSDDNNKSVVLKGDINTRIDIDGREVAIATAPYVSEEIAFNGGV